MASPAGVAGRLARAARPGQILLTLQQVEAEFGLPASTTRDLVSRGHLPAVRLPSSRRVWVRRADLDLLVKASVTGGGA